MTMTKMAMIDKTFLIEDLPSKMAMTNMRKCDNMFLFDPFVRQC